MNALDLDVEQHARIELHATAALHQAGQAFLVGLFHVLYGHVVLLIQPRAFHALLDMPERGAGARFIFGLRGGGGGRCQADGLPKAVLILP